METIIIIIIMGQVKRYYANWKFGSVQIEIAGLPLNAIQMVCFGVWMETHTISCKKTYTVLLVFLCWLDKEYLLHLGGKINSPLDSQSQFAWVGTVN